MAQITYYVMVPFKLTDDGVFAETGIQCPTERSAIAQAKSAVAKGAIGAVAFSRSGDPALGEYGEAIVICREGDVPTELDALLAA